MITKGTKEHDGHKEQKFFNLILRVKRTVIFVHFIILCVLCDRKQKQETFKLGSLYIFCKTRVDQSKQINMQLKKKQKCIIGESIAAGPANIKTFSI
jgi:hypothetical protein